MKKILAIFFIFFNVFAFAQSVPYNVNKKKFPLGDEFDKILPQKLGEWERYAFHDFVIGREMGKVFYTNRKNRVFITFGKAYSQLELSTAWTNIYDDAISGKKNEIKQQNTNSSNKYLLMNGESGFLFAWTRNFYYFSIEAKSKQLADEFMKVFPY
ncbi:MAG: hypothetical protein RJA25_363 [Bacteroidota bacterium]|jgi:hypothetical protein